MKKNILFFIITLLATNAYGSAGLNPYKMLIVCDPGACSEANKYVTQLRTIEPFNCLGAQFEITVKEMDLVKLGCWSSIEIARLTNCNNFFLPSGYHKTVIVSSTTLGGSGGDVPTVGIMGGAYGFSTLLHELLHSYNLGDEYEYDATEAAVYCPFYSLSSARENIVYIAPLTAYSSDAEARTKHSNQIPWFAEINGTTLITTLPNLGTTPGIFPVDDAALYRGGDCNRVLPTWKPYYDKTIMKELDAPLVLKPIYINAILRSMSAERGEEIKLISPSAPETTKASKYVEKQSYPDVMTGTCPKPTGARAIKEEPVTK